MYITERENHGDTNGRATWSGDSGTAEAVADLRDIFHGSHFFLDTPDKFRTMHVHPANPACLAVEVMAERVVVGRLDLSNYRTRPMNHRKNVRARSLPP